MVVETLYSDNGEELFVRIPSNLVKQLNIKANDEVTLEDSLSCTDEGEYEGIILTFPDKPV